MTDEIRFYALPGDIVQLTGRIENGKVLDWTKQVSMDRREFEQTHYPIGPIDAEVDSRAIKFWPMTQVTMIKRVPVARHHDSLDDPIRF